MRSDKSFSHNGGSLDKVPWPFKRHKILVSKPSDMDVFEWLFVSFVRYLNIEKGRGETSCNSNVIDEVRYLLKNDYGGIINSQTVDMVADNVSRDYVTKGCLTDDALLFSNEFESIFTDEFEVKYIFQDCMTGEVVPWFFSEEDIADGVLPKQSRIPAILSEEEISRIKNPSNDMIVRASRQYGKILRLTQWVKEYDNSDSIEDRYLEDSVTEEKSRGFSAKIVDTTIECYDVEAEIVNTKLCLRSPFNRETNYWMEQIYEKARNSCESFLHYAEEHYDKYIESEIKSETNVRVLIRDAIKSKGSSNNIVSAELSMIYDLVERYADEDLLMEVYRMDKYYKNGDRTFYLNCGIILEILSFKIDYEGKTVFPVRNKEINVYCKEIKNKLNGKAIGYQALLTSEIHDRWKKRMDYKRWAETCDFKPDLAEMIMNTNLTESRYFKKDSIMKMLDIYDLRNKVAHNNKEARRLNPHKSYVRDMEEIITLFNSVTEG